MAGGSNLVIADAGFKGTVVRVLTRGISADTRGDRAGLFVAAGEPWDELVARCVAEGLAGIECLSGIPGSTGATPIQNVGAYGQEVADRIASVRAYDREARTDVELAPTECKFAYRSSVFRRSTRYVVRPDLRARALVCRAPGPLRRARAGPGRRAGGAAASVSGA